MPLDKTQIRDLARLARLTIDDQAREGYTRDLADILALVEQMNEVNTSAIEPLAHPLEIATQLRPDRVTEVNQRDHFQEAAPMTAEGHYLVPKFIE